MQLTTPVPIQRLPYPIDYTSKIVLLGSCFTEHIGRKLAYHAFDTLVNPFGIIFNSHSLKTLVERAVIKKPFTIEDTEGSYSYLAHSDLNNQDSHVLLENLNRSLQLLHESLQHASHLFITLGTAWAYRHIEKDLIVANCHKQPPHLFKKELLSTVTMQEDLKKIKQLITSINPETQLTYTLSPVRHLKDGFIENQRSKSRLHEVLQHQVDLQNANYFPAYEIAMDELRDYRFYARDMVHLNDLGVDYIWSRFRESAINTDTSTIQNAVEKYRKLESHRPTDKQKHSTLVNQLRLQLLSQFPQIKL